MKKVILLFFKTIAVILGIFVAFAILFIPVLFLGNHSNTQTIDSVQTSAISEEFSQSVENSQM